MNLKAAQKRKYDKHAKQMKPINVGDNVRIQQGVFWNPAVVTEQNSDRQYHVKTTRKEGNIFATTKEIESM
ncbi:hypothetical protein ACF0H5_017902 [Mactra antiquata]